MLMSVKECNFERLRRLVKYFSYRKFLREHQHMKLKGGDQIILKRILIGYAEQYKWIPQHIPKEQTIKYLAHLRFTLDIADGVIIPCSTGKVHFARK